MIGRLQNSNSHLRLTKVIIDHRGQTSRVPLLQAEGRTNEEPYLFCSVNPNKRTLRGFHLQKAPHGEKKLITCLTGSIFLALYDPNYSQRGKAKLTTYDLISTNGQSVFVEEGLATAWLTTSENTTVLYQIQGPYFPESSTGFRWDDPMIGVSWPGEPLVISKKDLEWSFLSK